jgi:hypothetical protein
VRRGTGKRGVYDIKKTKILMRKAVELDKSKRMVARVDSLWERCGWLISIRWIVALL